MKRRDFIRGAAPLVVVPFFSNQLFAAALPHTLQDEAVLGMLGPETDRVLVIVQMSGGNDGLNMVLPLDQYSNLSVARANILVPDTNPLLLGSAQTALHPAMTGLKTLFDQQKLSVIQGVSYANPNFSHFRANDIFNTGSDSATVLTTGWLGRYLEYAFPGFPDAYPSTLMPDPLSIRIGSSNVPALQGYEISTGQTVPSNFTGTLTQLLSYQNTSLPAGNAATELAFLREQQLYTNQYGTRIVNAWNAGTNLVTYPAAAASQNLPAQLKIVARLIKGGLKTRVYWVSMGGFDTHATQVVAANKATGTHANLLKELSDSIAAFQTDLAQMGLEDRVIGMTYSEFGRRIMSNASAGTDHGAAAPMFVFGKKVAGRVIGKNPVIPSGTALTVNSQVAMQYDFKAIYQSVLQEWFCLTTADANTTLGDTTMPNVQINGGCSVVLPVELARFTVEKANLADAHLTWTTASENGTETFDIERSTDAKKFSKVGDLVAKGHAHEPQNYDFLDKDLPLSIANVFYYRLKIKDLDGSARLSETRSVAYDSKSSKLAADIAPNPSNGQLTLTFKTGVDLDKLTEVTVNDVYGRRVAQFHENVTANSTISLDLATAVNGIYMVTIKNGNNTLVQKIVVQH
jgi:uncharacterized protein (DUF1501 family)